MSKMLVTWEQVNHYLDALIGYLARTQKLEKVVGIYGIPRGGLVLAVMLSHRLNVPLLLAPCKDCIVIDDIADTGITLKHYAESNYFITTMFYHEQSIVVPNYWFFDKTNKWVVYPWEDTNV
jgi:hypoxanthine phosphoribosyltransferase